MLLYHPSHRVPDLGAAEEFFSRVFGRPSTPLAALARPRPDGTPPAPGTVPDHSTFTVVADVLFDSIDPRRYVVDGVQRYPDVTEPHLEGLGWYVEDIGSTYRSLREHGFTVVDQLDRTATGDEPPTAAGSPMPLCFTVPGDAGLRYELVPRFPFPLDPRLDPGWELPAPSDDDPLGIVRCAHHTVLTRRPDRALRLLVDVLGGTVVDEGRDEVLGATATWVHLGDAVLQCATPDDGTEAAADAARSPDDTYHALAWQVLDLDRAERHLRSVGVGIRARSDADVVVDPATALGVPWRFTTSRAPGDPRP